MTMRIVADGLAPSGVRITVGDEDMTNLVSRLDVAISPDELVLATLKLPVHSLDVKALARLETIDGKHIHSITLDDGTIIKSDV